VKRRLLALGAIACAIGAVLLFAGSVIAGPGEPPANVAAPPLPTLSDQERANAASLATSALEGLIHSNRFAVRDVGVWHTHGLHKLGAVVVITAHQAGPFRATWPTIDYDRSEKSSPPYKDDHVQLTVSHVQEWLILVDLKRQKVVQVAPSGIAVEETNVAGNARRRNVGYGD
jgi:hypothetical protein